MPDLKRIPLKLNCKGIDLEHTVDEIPAEFFARLTNVRALQQGGIEARPATTGFATTTNPTVHTIRRLNNLLPGASPSWALLVGDGTELSIGQAGALTPIASGFSGNPLSPVAFRPENSPESWMYFGDSSKMVKANVESTVYGIGVLPPQNAPEVNFGQPAFVDIQRAQASGDWTLIGNADTLADGDRFLTTVNSIIYDTGNTGWCCFSPVSGDGYFADGAEIEIDSEWVLMTQVLQEIPATTIAGIAYDSGATGACSIIFAAASYDSSTPIIARNSLVQIAGEPTVTRILQVIQSADGLSYSVRCRLASTRAAGDVVTGALSVRAYTTVTHAAGAALASKFVSFHALAGTTYGGIEASPTNADLSKANGRLINLTDDYMHISIYCAAPENIVSGQLLVDVDVSGTEFTSNYYQVDLTQDMLATGASGWNEIVIALADMKRFGNNIVETLAAVRKVAVQFICTVTTGFEIDGWYFTGTYGPNSGVQTPVGGFWRYRYRDSRTGAKSIPSPVLPDGAFPLRQEVDISVTASADAQVDTIDIERLGAGVDSYTYIGSTANVTGVFKDTYDAQSLAGNPALETDVFKPFLVEDAPWNGTVNVVGNNVTWASGTVFDIALAPSTEITIAGIATQVLTMPTSTTRLQITQNLGVLTGAVYSVSSPALMGQPLRNIFGPLTGPTAAYVFGLGDPRNPGLLYWMNGNDADSQGQANFIEITPPSEPLKCGCVWGSLVFVASELRVFLVQPSYTQSGNLFVQTQLTSASGCHSPWGMAAGVDGVYMLGRDGVYLLTQNGANYLSKALWPLWPHEGKPAVAVNGYNPVDMAQEEFLRVEYADSSVFVTAKDSADAMVTWRMAGEGLEAVFSGDPAEFRRGWFFENYNPQVLTHYFEEVAADVANTPNPRLLKGTVAGTIVAADAGTTDSGNAIACQIRTGSNDLGDPRTQKLYMDVMSELQGTAQLTLGFNRFSSTLAPAALASAGRGLTYSNVTTLAANSLVLRQDIAAQWDFAPGTVIYEFQPSFYLQPFYGYELTMQLGDCGIPGWKQLRYYRMAVISTAPVTLTIINDDGVTLASIVTTATTAGALLMSFGNLPNASKGRMLRFSLTCGTPFAAFPEDCFVRIKKWGGKMFVDLQPFIVS